MRAWFSPSKGRSIITVLAVLVDRLGYLSHLSTFLFKVEIMQWMETFTSKLRFPQAELSLVGSERNLMHHDQESVIVPSYELEMRTMQGVVLRGVSCKDVTHFMLCLAL